MICAFNVCAASALNKSPMRVASLSVGMITESVGSDTILEFAVFDARHQFSCATAVPQPLPDDYEERRDRAYSVDPLSQASNPGDYRVQWPQFFRAFPQPARGIAFALIFLLSATLRFHWLWAVPLVGLLVLCFLLLRRVREHFAFGNTLPAVIVSHDPPLIAALTDLTTGFGDFNTIKILDQPLKECGLSDAPIGTRIPTVALYRGTGESGHWDDFFPVLLAAATRKPEAHARAMASFDEDDWRELEDGLATLPEKTPGLHALGWDLPTAPNANEYRRSELLFFSDMVLAEPEIRIYTRGENTPRILCLEWKPPRKPAQTFDGAWLDAVTNVVLSQQTPDALLLDFARFDELTPTLSTWLHSQASRLDLPVILVLSEQTGELKELINVQTTRDEALDWMEKRLQNAD